LRAICCSELLSSFELEKQKQRGTEQPASVRGLKNPGAAQNIEKITARRTLKRDNAETDRPLCLATLGLIW
jgi:hypothetical protein